MDRTRSSDSTTHASRCIRGRVRCATRPFSRWLREDVRVVQRPPFSHCVLGRTPASGRRAPQRVAVTLLESTSGFASCSPRPTLPRKRTIEAKKALDKRPPPGVAASSRGGPTEHAVRGGGTLHNANAISESRNRVRPNEVRRGRVAKHKPPLCNCIQSHHHITTARPRSSRRACRTRDRHRARHERSDRRRARRHRSRRAVGRC